MIELYNGDCLIESKKIENNSINLILTDLPYSITNCEWDSIIPFDLMWEMFYRVLKDNGCIVLTANNPFTSKLIMSNLKDFKYQWIWVKQIPSNHLNAKKQPLRAFEDVLVFYKNQPTYNPQLTDKPKGHIRNNPINITNTNTGVYNKTQFEYKRNEFRDIPTDKNYPLNVLHFDIVSKNKRIHPTQKPIELMEYLIKTYTNENDTVLDCTMGSGTTGIACVNTNRNFIGIEKDKTYFELSENRIRLAQGNLKNNIFDF